MPTPKVVPDVRCKTCHSPAPYRNAINEMLVQGLSAYQIDKAMRAEPYNFPIKQESILKHVKKCAGGDRANLLTVLPNESRALPPGPPLPSASNPQPIPRVKRKTTPEMENDFAAIVHERALEEMEAGTLRVSTKDGLAARALLDRREEKKQDRLLMMGLARLLSGAGGAGPVLSDGQVIDGAGLYQDVTPLSLLAPESVREEVA